MKIKLWLNDELLQEKNFPLPFNMTDQSKKNSIDFYIHRCHLCGEFYVSKRKKSMYCTIKHRNHAKRIKRKKY